MDTPRRRYRRKASRQRPTNITVPALAGPHVRLVFAEMKRRNIRYDDVEDGSGVLRSTLKAWRHKNAPGLTSIEAVLGFLGFDFVPIPSERVLSPELLAELRPIADRLAIDMPTAVQLAAEIAFRDHHLSARTRFAV